MANSLLHSLLHCGISVVLTARFRSARGRQHTGVEALLNELAERPEGALVAELPRQPGSRENRWMHLLSGAPAVESSSAAGLAAESPSLGISELAAVKANVARLEAEVQELKGLLARVCAQLGIKQ